MLKPRLFFIPLLSFLFNCQNPNTSLSSQTIFSIPVGIMRNEINLFSQKDLLYSDNSNFTLTPLGSYFITDRSSHKIFYYTNYGKLNYIIYNPEYRYDSDKKNSQYLDKTWPFGEISEIAANLTRLYVASTLSKNTADPNDLYTQVILTFDDKGEFLYQLGTNGTNSRPFRYRITKLFIDKQNQLFAISRHPEAYQIYQFSDKGKLLNNFELSVKRTILAFQNRNYEEDREFFEITSPSFSYDGKSLFFGLYRYTATVNDATFRTRQINAYSYDIYSIEVASPFQTLKKNFTIRKFNSERLDAKQMYGEQLLGTTSNDLLVFLQTYPNGKNILVYYDKKGNRKHIVNIDFKQDIPYKLYLAPNGLVSALNFYEDRVSVTWWRTDKLSGKELPF